LDGRGASAAGGGGGGGGAHLSGGTIAGIVVGCVLAVALVAAAIAFCILRKRRKWMRAGFAAVDKAPEPDTSVLEGPVFNSGGRTSTAAGSTPMSAAAVSAARSTGERSSFGGAAVAASTSPPKPVSVVDGNAELDGRDTQVEPDNELAGTAVNPIARNPGVYELPATPAAEGESAEAQMERAHSTLGNLPTHGEIGGVHDSPPSPYVSTMGSAWGQDDRAGPDHLVSPDTPVRRQGPF